ncbi:MAG TPA: hypothetical protein PLJ25_00040 [Methanothrix sp.]|nr:hypothetical protein [Methanothrix sp.]
MTDMPQVCENCGFSLAEGDKFCPMCKTPAEHAAGGFAPLKRIKRVRPAVLLASGVLLGFIMVASAIYLPQYVEDWNQKGNDALNRSDFKSSVEYFSKALELDPSSDEALIGLGNTYSIIIQDNEESYDLPLSYYEEANKSNKMGGSAYALKKMGLIHISIGDYSTAQKEFQKIIDLNTAQNNIDSLDLASAWYYKGSALMYQNNYNSAMECFNNSMSISGGEVAGRRLHQMAMASMGEAFMKENKSQEAENFYKSALDVSTDCENCDAVCHDLIKIYEKSNRIDDAREYEEKCYGKAMA